MRLEGGFTLETESFRYCPASAVVPIYMNLDPAAAKLVERECGQNLGGLGGVARPTYPV